MNKYIKCIIALAGGVSAWGITAASDNAISLVELFGLIGSMATAAGVYWFPNSPLEPVGEELSITPITPGDHA